MILSRIDNGAVGKILGHNIYDDSGRPLLKSGVRLNERYVRRLKEKGYLSVYVRDELAPDLVPEETIDTETRKRAVGSVRQLSQRMHLGESVDVGRISSVVDEIVEDLKACPEGIISLSSMKTVDDYTFEHSVNVCILSTYLWWYLYGDGCPLIEMGMGALLHDVGKLAIPLEILLKPGSLTREEYSEVKRHARVGYNALREILPENSRSPMVAGEHHERLDGSGYPLGIDADRISRFGRIAAVADIYDAVTSDRVYRDGMRSHEAMALLADMAGTQLDAEIVEILGARVAHYPGGTRVSLGNGQLGIVVGQDQRSSRRPRIRLLTDASGAVLPAAKAEEIALFDEPQLEIAEVLDEYPDEVLRQA